MPEVKNKSIFISAGEQSGEMHGADLVNALMANSPEFQISFSGLGGGMMKSCGVDLLYETSQLAAVGLLEVAEKYGFFKKVLSECLEFVEKNNPDTVVLIDYPGFNLRFAAGLRKFYKGKIIYYISPQIWAWNEKRVHRIRKNIDKMLVVFPFEVEFYRHFDVDAEYVGNPLVTRISKFLSENKRPARVFGEKKVVTFLPGSRNREISLNLPTLLKIGKQLRKEFDLTINISKAQSVGNSSFEKFLHALDGYNLTTENVYKLVLNSDLVLTKAGTSTLECALIGAPHLIFLKTSPLNYLLMKPFVKINNIGIVNIIAKEQIVREFIQKEFTAENVLPEARSLLTDENHKNILVEKLKKVWGILGNENAAVNAALIIKQTALEG